MERLYVKLFGKPEIQLDDASITIKLKRSEALLYYLVYEKRVDREQLVHLIWPDVEIEVAKKNLRNALYRIKKDLGQGFFSTPNKHTIECTGGETSLVETDVHQSQGLFMQQYRGTFLEGFSFKGDDDFQRWRLAVEMTLNQRYKRLSDKAFQEAFEAGKYSYAFDIAQTLHQIDPYDEVATQMMMNVHQARHQIKEMIRAYDQLKDNLDREMGIAPNKETTALYYQLLQKRQDQEVKESLIFGRVGEFQILMNHMQRQEDSLHPFNLLIVEGEAGVGKTKLIQAAVENFQSSTEVIWGYCYMMEQHFAYKTFNKVLGQLFKRRRMKGESIPRDSSQVLGKVFPDIMPEGEVPRLENIESIRTEYVERLLCKVLREWTEEQPIVLIFDDMQWMDDWSVGLLETLVLNVPKLKIIASLRKCDRGTVHRMMTVIGHHQRLIKIPLGRFSPQETHAFLDEMTDFVMTREEKDKVYEASEGNAFFIVEYVGFYHRNDAKSLHRIKNLLDARMMEVSAEGQKILDMIAIFFDGAEHQFLEKLYAKPYEQLIDVLEELRTKDFIREFESAGTVVIDFTHHKLRAHIEQKMSAVTRKVLHRRVGELIEAHIPGDSRDIAFFQKLMYHFEQAGELSKSLKYTLCYLKNYFDFSHELYPEGHLSVDIQLDYSPEYYFSKIEALLDHAHLEEGDNWLRQYYHMKARYLIRRGDYEEGLSMIEQLMALSLAFGDEDMLFKASVQKIYYLIQTERPFEMAECLEEMKPWVKTPKRKAMYSRFQGIYHHLLGEYDQARQYFVKSIQAFKNLHREKNYALNIAAGYNYISETYLKEDVLELALEYAHRAIGYCKKYNILRGRSIFNTNAGAIAYALGEWDLAKAYLQEALKFFDMLDLLWRRSEAEGYLGIIEIAEGNVEKGWSLLMRAKKRAQKMHTPKTIGLLNQLEELAIQRYEVTP